MNGLGSGENGQFTFLDIISIISFLIGIMNLEENVTQGDKQELMQKLDENVRFLLTEIHTHLQEQDNKINSILAYMEAHYDSNGNSK
jgi:hypothetical protein